jgi:hypothetical protein
MTLSYNFDFTENMSPPREEKPIVLILQGGWFSSSTVKVYPSQLANRRSFTFTTRPWLGCEEKTQTYQLVTFYKDGLIDHYELIASYPSPNHLS